MTDDERDARIDTLTDAIADTNRNVNAIAGQVASLAGQVASLADAQAVTERHITLLASDITSLARLMRQHLRDDHGYPEIGDDDA